MPELRANMHIWVTWLTKLIVDENCCKWAMQRPIEDELHSRTDGGLYTYAHIANSPEGYLAKRKSPFAYVVFTLIGGPLRGEPR